MTLAGKMSLQGFTGLWTHTASNFLRKYRFKIVHSTPGYNVLWQAGKNSRLGTMKTIN